MQYVENGTVTSHTGIDVSKYQGDIDWTAVKADGIEYAFIRLGIRGYVAVDQVFRKKRSEHLERASVLPCHEFLHSVLDGLFHLRFL